MSQRAMLIARLSRLASLGAIGLFVGLGLPASAASANPVVSISSPAPGSTVKGIITISATGTADTGDYPTQITVYDGVNQIGQINCQGQQTCAGTVQWDATGLSGQHELTATVDTNNGLSATSAPVDVTVVSPSPTVAITSPRAGSLVTGTVTVAASGATDPNQSDYPTQIAVNDGTNQIGQINCQGQQTCAGTVQWDTSGLSGRQALSAVIDTNRGLSATSPVDVVTVAVYTKPILTVSRPAIERSGQHVTVSGLVRATARGPGLKGIVVRATYLPSTGGPQIAVTKTSASGTYSVLFRAVANGEVTVATAASGFYRASSARVAVTVDASVACQLSLRHIALDQSDTGVCTARGEPPRARHNSIPPSQGELVQRRQWPVQQCRPVPFRPDRLAVRHLRSPHHCRRQQQVWSVYRRRRIPDRRVVEPNGQQRHHPQLVGSMSWRRWRGHAQRTLASSVFLAVSLLTAICAATVIGQSTTTSVASATGISYQSLGYPWEDATPLVNTPKDFEAGYTTCPNDDQNCFERKYNGYGESDPWGYYLRNCTSYVAWLLSQDGVPTKYFDFASYAKGDAESWLADAQSPQWSALNGATGSTPEDDAVAVSVPDDHVMFVTSTDPANSPPGDITVEEYNQNQGGPNAGEGDIRTDTPADLDITGYIYYGRYIPGPPTNPSPSDGQSPLGRLRVPGLLRAGRRCRLRSLDGPNTQVLQNTQSTAVISVGGHRGGHRGGLRGGEIRVALPIRDTTGLC